MPYAVPRTGALAGRTGYRAGNEERGAAQLPPPTDDTCIDGKTIIGLLIEITFIATFTQRFFAR